MSQSLTLNYVHITFSTRNRENLIDDAIKNELFQYLGGICKQLECNPLRVGGHKKMTFQDEYRAFLKKYKIEYDERYVWD